MRLSAAVLGGAVLLVEAAFLGCGGRPEPAPSIAEATGVAAPRLKAAPARGPRPQPRPGERVPQPELDGYCGESGREAAYYYHGGSPVVRVAREQGCAPLYITDCELAGRCDPPRDQEPGMWCCATPEEPQQTAARTPR